jgi:putative copper resistance protein D
VIGFFAVIRWLQEASLMALFGDAALRLVLGRRLPALAIPRESWRRVAGLLALASAALWLFCAAGEMAGSPGAGLDPGTLKTVITQTLFGEVFLARLGLILFLCVGIYLDLRESLLALLAGSALVLISVTSHAAEASPAHFTAIGAISDGLHFLTGGFWIGGLSVLTLLFVKNREHFARAIVVFAEWGMIAVVVLVLTGMLNAATILLGGEGHDAPVYLSVLGAKLVLVMAMIGFAVFNHFRLLPKLMEQGPAARLDKNIRMEFTLGLVVVGLAVVLSLLQPTLQ